MKKQPTNRETPAPISAPVSFVIMLGATDAIHAMEIYHSLIGNGVSPSAITSNVSRVANSSPSIASGEKGPHETALCEYLGIQGRRATFNSNMQANFGLSGTREDMAEKFLALLQSGKVIKTQQGYKASGAHNVAPSGRDISASISEGEEINCDEVV